MNAKMAKLLRDEARQTQKPAETTYVTHNKGRLIDIIFRGEKAKFRYPDSLRVSPLCLRGEYLAAKRNVRRSLSAPFVSVKRNAKRLQACT